jgi:ABC-type antimicrobial peptide transport system permease subunit
MHTPKCIRDRLEDPVFMRKFHGWAALIWFAAAFPICIFLSSWIPGIVFMSVYAIVTGHWGSWQASRVEVIEIDCEDDDEG